MTRKLALAVLLIGLWTACSTALTPPGQPPTFAPSATVEITPVPLILTPVFTPEALPGLPPLRDSQSSKSLAANDEVLVTVNSDSDSITLVDLETRAILAEIEVGDDPRAVAITPDSELALITLRGEHALAVVNLREQRLNSVYAICHMPYGVVTDGRSAVVSCFGEDQIVLLDLAAGEVTHRIRVADAPSGLALSDNWLLVTHFYSGYITVIELSSTPTVIGTINVEPDGNLARSIVIAPDGERAYIPQTRTGLALISLQYQQDWFPVVSVLDIGSMTGNRDERLTLSMIDDYATNMPFDVAFNETSNVLYTVLAGSDMVLAIAPETQQVLARIPVGANPRGIIMQGERAYVLNMLAGSVSVIDTQTHTVTNTLQVTTLPQDAQWAQGKILFHQAAAPIMSDGAISCATCHFDGGMDRRTWINFRSGPRNTPALGGAARFPPYNWAGEMVELHDTIEDQIQFVMLGEGLISDDFDPMIDRTDAGRSADLDALAAYVTALEPWPSPYRAPDGSLSPAARRGMTLFMSGSPDCSCHGPPMYTDLQQHNLAGAAFSLEVYEAFDTPTLRGLWATAPYMHDGVAQTLEEVLTRTDPVHSVAHGLTDQQLADLIAFLLSL